jgi:hypothetical protein
MGAASAHLRDRRPGERKREARYERLERIVALSGK